MDLFRTKPIVADQEGSGLKRCLTAFDLILLGVGAIIGAGIFVLTGIAAATKAGPAIVYSYMLAGVACTFTAFAYAELAASIGGCGSAYGYTYAGLGELIAWIIGWNLLLEYGVSCSVVAIGWSSYVSDALASINIHLPIALLKSPFEGGVVDLPAMLIVLILAVLLIIGIRASAHFNSAMVFIKLLAIAVFIVVAAHHVNPIYWHPFMPFGWHGVVSGAALIFFAYIGFDAVSTAAEEAINPQRDLPIGILASLVICTLLYVAVAGLLTGIAPYQLLNNGSPVANVLLRLKDNIAAGMVAAGAIAGLTTVILVMFYGATRIFLAMARDGLIPAALGKVNSHTRTPIRIIVLGAICIALISGFMPMAEVAELVNIGTLAAFCLVSAGVVVLRYTQPDLPRPFKTPLNPLIPTLGIIFSLYLMVHLDSITWWRFVIWSVIGFVIYFGYGRSHSLLAK